MGGAQRPGDAGRLVGVLAAADQDGCTLPRVVHRFHQALLAAGRANALPHDACEFAGNARRWRRRVERFQCRFRDPRRLGWRALELLQRHQHPRCRAGRSHVRHDLSGLQSPVARNTPGPLLEELQQAEVDVFMQRFQRADAFVADRQRVVDAGEIHADVEALEVGFLRRPDVATHRLQDAAEERFVHGLFALVDLRCAAGLARNAQPPGRRKQHAAAGANMFPIRREHALAARAAVLEGQRNFVVQVCAAGGEVQLHVRQQRSQWIGLEQEASGQGARMHGVAHRGRGKLITCNLFEEEVQERLVGAAQPGAHARFAQPGFGAAAGRRILEQPAFDDSAFPFRLRKAIGPRDELAGCGASSKVVWDIKVCLR